jgi:hypothetical protein
MSGDNNSSEQYKLLNSETAVTLYGGSRNEFKQLHITKSIASALKEHEKVILVCAGAKQKELYQKLFSDNKQLTIITQDDVIHREEKFVVAIDEAPKLDQKQFDAPYTPMNRAQRRAQEKEQRRIHGKAIR